MYLHIGNNRIIRTGSIVGIFEMDNATVSMVTRNFLSNMQKDYLVEAASYEIPKSFILYEEHGECKVCFSPLSVSALKGRIAEKKI
ncbi:MAG: DUF370 domain-containing protein [Ruminococcaceae bacterium]|nr:DUF370 domain-containing protein [Oscillospiraceae bacterium]